MGEGLETLPIQRQAGLGLGSRGGTWAPISHFREWEAYWLLYCSLTADMLLCQDLCMCYSTAGTSLLLESILSLPSHLLLQVVLQGLPSPQAALPPPPALASFPPLPQLPTT